ncbi:cation diffusion facilitator family transporter [Haloferax sp. MBLA0076]|uniref:Cation diffusion facilitator family transporter n=1 Tax=Haloferax litoreum TaxID=2666140 RepID=A0A6A8GJJ7_9EURY|nr:MULTISPECIES: cation diffusion facilitator family transporter [Haloferax]KAB1193726.1 cation transporter [Haloferax sp. CBA1148]MRX22257.1 cation diffusion facilitator family transporter [Haloferax litoreum]
MERKRAIRRVAVVVLVANVLLVLGKGAVWWTTGSLAVGSEAVNSLADVIYSTIILAGLYLTTKPPDFEHPHGHERIEPFVSLFVAVGIFAAGGAILWQSTSSILDQSYGGAAGTLGVLVLVAAGVFKYVLYRYCLNVGKESNSPALVAAALDNRNDILTAAAALVGVVGAQMGYPILDPLAAMVVSIGIIYTGYEIVRDNVNYLVGAAPPEYLRALIVQTALSHPDVQGAHDVVAHYVGPEIDVSLHIEVEGDMTLTEAHDIETWVVQAIRDIDEVDDVFVHIDPKELGEWKDDHDEDRFTMFTPDGGDDR